MEKITLGFDTEFCFFDLNQYPKSLVGLVGGTKKTPLLFNNSKFFDEFSNKERYNDFYIQEDNVFLEINTPIITTTKDFVSVMKKQNQIIDIIAKKLNLCSLNNSSSIYFPNSELNSEQANEFGCDPDFNAWTGKVNESPKRRTNLRTTGAHLHIGYENHSLEQTMEIVKFLDITFGLFSIAAMSQNERVLLYGKMGAFRPKPYGLEYRFLPTAFLPHISRRTKHSSDSGYIDIKFDQYINYSSIIEFIKAIVKITREHTLENFVNKDVLDLIIFAILSNDHLLSRNIIKSKYYNDLLLKICEYFPDNKNLFGDLNSTILPNFKLN